jgi:hypothetical protein
MVSRFCGLVLVGVFGFLSFLGFAGVFLSFSYFFLFWCPFCILPVCIGVPLHFLKITLLPKQKKKKKKKLALP